MDKCECPLKGSRQSRLSFLKAENYLNVLYDKYARSLLAKLRNGILPLKIESGYYVSEKLDDIICKFFGQHKIESETLFIADSSLHKGFKFSQ